MSIAVMQAAGSSRVDKLKSHRARRLPERQRAELVRGDRAEVTVAPVSAEEVMERMKAVEWWLSQQKGMNSQGGMRRVEETTRLLGEHKVLRTRHLQALLWERPIDNFRAMTRSSAEKLAEATLAVMRAQGLVRHIWMQGQGSGSGCYVLDDVGLVAFDVLLGEVGASKRRKASGKQPAMIFGERTQKFNHDLAIADFMVAVKLDIEELGGNVDWVSSRRSRRLPGYGNDKGQLQWDALGLSGILGLSLDWMLELDNNSMEQPDMVAKVVAYANHYKKHCKGEVNTWQGSLLRPGYPEVLIVTTGTEVRMEHLLTRMMTMLHQLGFDSELTMSFTTTTRIEQAMASGGAHNPLDAPVWATLNWERGKSEGVREDYFPIIDYQQLLGELEKKMRELLADLEAAEVAAKPRLRERLATMKAVVEKLLPRVQIKQGGIQ